MLVNEFVIITHPSLIGRFCEAAVPEQSVAGYTVDIMLATVDALVRLSWYVLKEDPSAVQPDVKSDVGTKWQLGSFVISASPLPDAETSDASHAF